MNPRYNADNTKYQNDLKKEKVIYDDIVDRSNFVIDKETVRQKKLSTGGASGQIGVYDEKEATTLEVALRSGKLDKADVHQLMLKEQKNIETKNQKNKKEKLEKARQEAIDKSLGIISESQADLTKTK